MIKRKPSPTLAALQSENADFKKLIQQFKLEMSHLQTKYAKLEVKYFSSQVRIKALEEEKSEPKHEPLSSVELASKIAYLFAQHGIRFHIDTPIKKETSPQQGIQPDGE